MIVPRCATRRSFVPRSGPPKGLQPGAKASIAKLVSTELSQRIVKMCGEAFGRRNGYATLKRRSPLALDGDWLRRILASESTTIAAGTSSVQRNIIGERILGLPKR